MATITNPLGVGRYWIDLIGQEKIDRFVSFMANPELGKSHINLIHTEYHPANVSMVPGTADTPVREWVLFEVHSPIFWDFTFYGSPTIAGPNVTTEADTIQSPPVEDMAGVLDLRGIGQGIESAITTGLTVVAVGVGVAGLAWLLSNVLGKKGR